MPADLKPDYFAALARVPVIIGLASDREWDSAFLRYAMSALAASRGFPEIAEAALELNTETAEKFMEWFYAQ